MALIKCNECGHEVSDKASVCPNCGCPIESVEAYQVEVMDDEPKKKKGWIWALVVALLCLISGIGYYSYAHFANDSKTESINVDSFITKEDIVELTPAFINAIKKYNQLGMFSEGLAAACKGEKWGYINTKGEEVIPTTIDAQCVGRFSEGLAFILTYDGFNVIDKEGKIVFKGKTYFDAMHYDCEDMPYFVSEKLYVPIIDEKNDFKYAVYDKQGNKIKTISLEEGENVYQKNKYGKFSIYTEEHQVTEKGKYSTVGMKDSIGNEILSADYEKINGMTSGTTQFVNGVVLVVLSEIINDKEGSEDNGGIVTEDTRYYYGYADMKGNDSFTTEQKDRCRESQKASIIKSENSQNNSDWLQGRWVGTDSGSGYPIEVIIDGYNLIEKINGQVCYNGSYQFNGDFIVYNDGNNFWPVDNERQVLTYDGSSMRKENRNSSSSSTSSNSSYNNSSSSSNELAKYDEKISQYYPIMEEAYQQFMRDVRSGGYTTITPPNSFYELSKACSSVGAAANEARKICIKKGDTAGEQKYERIWEREKRLYDSAYQILGNLH